MNIRWRNIGAFIFTLFVAFLLLRHGHAISDVLGHLEQIGPGHNADEKTVGLLALGFLCVSLVAIVRLLAQSEHKDRHDRHHGRCEDSED